MKIIYMGTPQFAVAPLRALGETGHEIVGVVTRIDKPAGRGKTLHSAPVKLVAEEKGLKVFQPRRVRDAEFLEQVRILNPDIIVVAAFGQILPKDILALPKLGCLNIHASLLPLYRGAAPINWAIIRGESVTGVTIMKMDEGMDTGAILMQDRVAIQPTDTAATLMEKLSTLGAQMITTALTLYEAGMISPIMQDGSRATLAPLLKKENGIIDWTLSAIEIHNRVRGLLPWPGAYSFLDGKMLKIITTSVTEGNGVAGRLYEKDKNTLLAGTGNHLLRILTIQPEGKKPMSAAEFMRGYRGLTDKKFESRTIAPEGKKS